MEFLYLDGIMYDSMHRSMSRTEFDPSHALLLCHSFEFDQGARFLLEKMQCVELLLRNYMGMRLGS
jgi:hypothetical protein